MVLANMEFKDQIWSPKRGRNRRERRAKEDNKRKRRSSKPRYGTLDVCMETTLSMDFVWITWNFKAWYG